jgi:5'-nucleotidase
MAKSRPATALRILCTNDDGIHAPGLKALEAIARALSGEVWVVAPELEQSGASHSLTLHAPLRVREAGRNTFAVHGTPTDCVLMAVRHILKDAPPDLVLSGVNRGANMANDVTYSGTIAAAMEGTALGIRSIALSQAYGFSSGAGSPVKWSCAQTHAPGLIRSLLAAGWPPGVLMNLNFPDRLPGAVTGIEVTRQGQRDEGSAQITEREDLRGNRYYWIGFRRSPSNPPPGTDLHAVYGGAISVTPLHMNLTEASALSALADVALAPKRVRKPSR